MQVGIGKNKRDTAQIRFNVGYSFGLFPNNDLDELWLDISFLLLQRATENLTHWLL